MATAAFFRTLPGDNDLRQDGADFRNGNEVFQMVPVGGSRLGQIRIGGGVVRIASADDSIVKIAPGPNLPPVKIINFNQPDLDARFTLIGGPNAGKTVIVAEDEKGNRLSHLAVSIKQEVSVRYHLLRLKDAINNQAMEVSRAEGILKNVEQLYLSQTNVRLIKQRSEELFIRRNLSDAKGILQLDELLDNKEIIIFQEIKKKGFDDVDVVVIFTWNIEGSFGPITTGRALDGRTEKAIIRSGPTIIYINTFMIEGKHVFTAAHEFGHHFGISHFAARPSNYLSDAGARGFKMTQDDIHHANRTGT